MSNLTKRFGTTCPVCDHDAFELLTRVWRNYHVPSAFRIDPVRWFAECRRCATVSMLPLHDDFDDGGTVYYDQADIAAHVRRHYEEFQKPNYDHIRAFLQRVAPADRFHRWLDVGSVGYPTTFGDYEFTTIEPDAQAARAGESLFRTGRIHAATLDRWHDERPYDGLLFNNSFYCLTDPGRTLRKAAALLRPGGLLVITSSSTFANAVSDREDGRILMIEDLLFGETVQVYYNSHSLTYLAGKHGFRLREIEEVPAYGCKTMQAHVFELAGASLVDVELLEQSRDQMARVWNETLTGFAASVADTLRQINRPDVVLAGPLEVIRDLASCGELGRIRGVLPVPEGHCAGAIVNGLRVLSMGDVRLMAPHSVDVVACGFTDHDGLVETLRRELGEYVQLLVPTRRSGMESLYFTFKNERRLSKGLALRALPYELRPLSLANRRVVIYGAGSGGREAAATVQACGGVVVAICDSDPVKAGMPFEGQTIVPFEDLSRDEYDVIVIASRPGLTAIARRLTERGLRVGCDFAGLDDLQVEELAGA